MHFYQSEFGEDWILPQWVIHNILQHSVVLPKTVTLPNQGKLSQTWQNKKQQTAAVKLWKKCFNLQGNVQNLVPANRTATPMQNRNLRWETIVQRAFSSWNHVNGFKSAELVLYSFFCTALSVFALISIQGKKKVEQSAFCFLCV